MVAVVQMSDGQKIDAMISRSSSHYTGPLKEQYDALRSPENLVIVSATFLLWAVSHFFGVGEIIDVALLLIGSAALGASAGQAIKQLVEASTICLAAQTEIELDRSAELFARAVTTLGIDAVMALLLRRSAKGIQVSRGAGVTRPSFMKVMTPRDPGLPPVGPDPFIGQLWSKFPAPRGVPHIPSPPGVTVLGETSWFGEIIYLLRGNAALEQATIDHEIIHQILTPRFAFLRTFRVQLRRAGYGRSVLLKYVEEAMAQGYSEVLRSPVKGVFKGIAFPVSHGYVTISQMGFEAQAVLTIMVGGQRLLVTLSPPSWANDVPYLKTNVEKIYGWWWSNVNGGLYSYSFARNGTVRWFDVNNHMNAQGKWEKKDGHVEVVWPTGTRETWPFELNPSDQSGTSVTTAKRSSTFKAVKVWDAHLSKIVGRWRMSCDKWIWNIDFAEDGTVRWSDYYSPSENGRGLWHMTKTGVFLLWASGSRDEWKIAENGVTASGNATVSGKAYTFSANKQ